MSDLIDRQAVIDLYKKDYEGRYAITNAEQFEAMLTRTPSVQPKNGKWIELHHAYADEENSIEEWQSCKCSICGRYDTRPYLYYFSKPHFCSWCGADMRGGQE